MTATEPDYQTSMEKQYAVMKLAAADPEIAAALASPQPQQMHADLAARCPVRHLGDGVYSLLTMDDIRFVNRHPAVEQGAKYLGSNRPAIPLGLDGPLHREYRRLLDPVFAPKEVEKLVPQVEALANELIDRFPAEGTVDAYDAWCQPLPSTIFLTIMGLPLDKLDEFIHFKDLTLGHNAYGMPAEQIIERRMEAVAWLQAYFNEDLDARERETTPRDDMIQRLLSAEVDGKKLTREDLLDLLGLLMIAGLDTVTSSLACFLSHFARHPEDRARVVAEPELTRTAIEELMRFESPVTEGFRITREDLTLPSGAEIPAGSWIHMSWSAANLDPATYPDPLRVDLSRQRNPHIGFASGTHRCLGSHLARMEMETAIRVWHQRFPDYAIAPGEQLVYSGNPRAPERLPLVLA